ncbi:MAG: redoxin domain-containing protein [Pseudomonadota bacterium]
MSGTQTTTANAEQDAPVRRRLSWQRLLLIEAALLLSMAAGVFLWLEHEARGPAHAFSATDLEGNPVSLDQYLADGPVVIRFWATWCPNCKREQHMIDSMADGGRVLTVAIQSGGERDVRAYVEAEGLDMPTIVDADGHIAIPYDVVAVPTTLIIDQDGEVRFRMLGLTGEWGLRLRLWLAGAFST